jgi:phosphoglycolate phosphatase-like HAD superfamily hydrolase
MVVPMFRTPGFRSSGTAVPPHKNIQLAKEYNICLEKSWFIGDTTIDIQTGKNAGTNTILLLTGLAGKDGKYIMEPDFVCEDLLSAVQIILGGKNEGRTD